MPDVQPAAHDWKISTRTSRGRPAAAFTLLELLVVIGIIGVVLAIVVPAASGLRRSSHQVKCLANLRQIGVGFALYAAENNDVLPDPAAAQASWEAMLLPKVQQRALFRCPSDDELFPVIGSSYDWRDTGDPASTLAGQKLTAAPPQTVLAFDSLPSWHAKRKMNAVFVDGSGRFLTDQECLENLSRAIRGSGPVSN